MYSDLLETDYACLRRGDPEAARSRFQHAIDSEPTRPQGYFALAQSYLDQDLRQETREALETALRIDPWMRRRIPTIILGALLLVATLFLVTACGEATDPSGLSTANQSNLTKVTVDGTTTISQKDVGLFFGDPSQLVAQIIGAVVCFVYVFGISWVFFTLYKRFFGLRVSPETELKGLDIPEMGR